MSLRVLGRTNPLVLVAIGLLAIAASSGVRDLRTGLISVAVIVVLGFAGVPGLGRNGWRYLGPGLAAASVAFSTWLLGGHDAELAAIAGLRILVLALPGAMVAPLVDPARLGDYLIQQLHLPARPVTAVAASLQRFEQLGAVWAQLATSRRARGLGAGGSPFARVRDLRLQTFGLLVAALRNASRISVAMDARGFATAHGRTQAQPAIWSRLDSAVLICSAVLAAVPYLA